MVLLIRQITAALMASVGMIKVRGVELLTQLL